MSISLEINNKDGLDLDDFCEELISFMTEYLISEIDDVQLMRFDVYINNFNIIRPKIKNTKIPKTRNILIGATNHYKVHKVKDDYIIELDETAKIPNCDAKFIDIVKLVNDGNLYVQKYPIYSEMIKFIEDNIYNLYDKLVGV